MFQFDKSRTIAILSYVTGFLCNTNSFQLVKNEMTQNKVVNYGVANVPCQHRSNNCMLDHDSVINTACIIINGYINV